MKRVFREPIEMKMSGFEVVEKTAESSGTSGRIYVPKKWIGKKVRAVLLE
jgi:putative transposon-encoded protein